MISHKAILPVFLFILALLSSYANALENGLARTPPMGWNGWNKFGCDVGESLIKQMADAMVNTSMGDAGYQYIVIDDCWQRETRDERGNIVAEATRFPSGIKALRLYSDAGKFTFVERCPGGKGYEIQDARQYAAWGGLSESPESGREGRLGMVVRLLWV